MSLCALLLCWPKLPHFAMATISECSLPLSMARWQISATWQAASFPWLQSSSSLVQRGLSELSSTGSCRQRSPFAFSNSQPLILLVVFFCAWLNVAQPFVKAGLPTNKQLAPFVKVQQVCKEHLLSKCSVRKNLYFLRHTVALGQNSGGVHVSLFYQHMHASWGHSSTFAKLIYILVKTKFL